LSSQSERNNDLSGLWEEDTITAMLINGVIEETKSWGSLHGHFAEMIKETARAKINWRNIFAGFRASIISSKRQLTRMRPNRRSGFQQMGSIRKFDTKLLVAVDVSGSISTKCLKYFYGVINSAFRYGFRCIDVIQFDCGVFNVKSLKKVVKSVGVSGRGGTSFQEPINFANENKYDGLVILTDGYAPKPTIPDHMYTKIIWVCENKSSYDSSHEWMEESGRVCTMEIGE
jgi:predicted metal-dependent peptidase